MDDKPYSNEDKPYSNRELNMKFEGIKSKIDENHVETLEKMGESDRRNQDKQIEMLNMLSEIKGMATKTNGRVNNHDAWIRGIVMCCSLIVVVVLPLLYVIYQQIEGRVNHQGSEITNLQEK